MTSAAVREPRQHRSRATRARLLDTAVEVLAELGWLGGTVTVVAERVGVSRGAVQHHFPTREDLFTAAIDHMAGDLFARTRLDGARIPAGPRRTEAVVEALVSMFRGSLYRAALNLWVAAVEDASLRAKVMPLDRRLSVAMHEMAVDLFRADESRPGVPEAIEATLDLARGLGVSGLLTQDGTRRRAIVRQWAASLDAVLASDDRR
ncbi:TetR/AcrR family transcriptional regulator [Embleya sp. NBC_00896]|uniref:TetR/AcrR family transcriptional regulator n=1 Tax=Embleya sp. NBC_00896 TaxID=2975961 RepID=UPI00386F9D00|nr:TetR/AcrR family transcriptional regulator [Embleya sp. NBC_00896]